MVTSQRDGH
jgi:2-hydroxychromene-2-carboxylate isomerase